MKYRRELFTDEGVSALSRMGSQFSVLEDEGKYLNSDDEV